MSLLLSDTICALATPPGVAGLAVVRVSGPQAITFCASHFVASTPLGQSESRTVRVGWWQVGEDNVDEVTATVFRHPNSYTGEDVVEIGCHGGPFVVDQILESLYHDGARAALPGEFTRRAFVNKKIDLTQVEAVADIIHSQSTVGAQTAARQLAGGFTRQLSLLRSNLLDSAGLLEIELDFSEEGYEFVSRPRFVASLREGLSLTEALMKTARGAQILRSGYHVAIVGFPNAGKSSLFNALVGKQRAIVSAIAGTTRDYIEERVVLSGYTIHLYDTAGLRDTDDSIEMQGIRVTASLVEQSNLVLVVNDAHQGLDASQPLVSDLKDRFPHVQVTTVQNKCDTLSADPDAWSELVRNGDLTVSAVMPQTLNALESFLVQGVSSSADGIHDVLVNSRQLALLTTLHSHLLSAMNAVTTNQPADLIAIDVRHAIHVMGEITGETWNPDVLDSVFSRFCIGK